MDLPLEKREKRCPSLLGMSFILMLSLMEDKIKAKSLRMVLMSFAGG
uniref:Alternative protein IARS2 n=1 Tax=Homo sapiens TaxID=9606 RepID=L8E8E9_HUMAN|nr:alternative protein IARS2 [Homo sapiens]